MIAVANFPTLLKFPLGGAQAELNRVARMFSGAFRRPVQNAFASPDTAAGTILASAAWLAQWKFNNNGNDSIGANNLTNNNSATFTTGKLGGANGATQLVAASLRYWSITDNAALSTGNVDFTICAWVYLDSKTAFRPIAIKTGIGGTGNAEYQLDYSNTSDRFRFMTFKASDGAAQIVSANNFGSPSLATWYLVIGWHDATAGTNNISVNDGTADSLGSVFASADSASPVEIGAQSSFTRYMDGRLDNVCFAKSAAGGGGVLSAAQRTALYNGGAGTEVLT